MRTKILTVGADDSPGGVTSYVNLLASLCDPKKFEFHSTVARINSNASYLHSSITKHLLPRSYSYCSFPLRIAQLRRILRGERITLLHLHTARAGLLGCIAAAGLPIAKIYTGHSWRFEQKTRWFERFRFFLYEAFICHSATVVTFETNREKNFGIRKRLVQRRKAVVINTRIDSRGTDCKNGGNSEITRSAFHIPANAKVIGNIGYLSERKDPIAFVLAAKRIYAEIPNAHFVWVGDGELRKRIDQLVRESGLDSRFTVTGFRPAEQVRPLLKLMDVLLFTSRMEGVPFTVLEAQLCGLPVVSSAYPGCEEIIRHDETGYTFQLGDDKQAADMVVRMLSDPQRTSQLVAMALRSATENHSDPRRMARQYEDVYLSSVEALGSKR
ncbi:MAG TPA: glycosyltransferase family 4 protein [Burkholderiales bacterium]|nr:glycosyltransferase family 4 protein [Burkholderiales bacterium]